MGLFRLLDDSLRRLRTDYLDLWQLHDLRTEDDLSRIFGKGGAMKALLQARTEGRVRYLGITGHHDPAILLAAMQEFDFDTVLVALNAADVHRLPFRDTVLPEAARRNMGVIGMKSTAQGVLLKNGTLTMAEAMGYVLSLPGVSTLIIGCKTPAEVDENARIAREFAGFAADRLQELEGRTLPHADGIQLLQDAGVDLFPAMSIDAARQIIATGGTEIVAGESAMPAGRSQASMLA